MCSYDRAARPLRWDRQAALFVFASRRRFGDPAVVEPRHKRAWRSSSSVSWWHRVNRQTTIDLAPSRTQETAAMFPRTRSRRVVDTAFVLVGLAAIQAQEIENGDERADPPPVRRGYTIPLIDLAH